MQLAKAAVRAGIDILLREAGMETADVARLYLAGGFGSAMRPESAARIGLIHEELSDRVTVLGASNADERRPKKPFGQKPYGQKSRGPGGGQGQPRGPGQGGGFNGGDMVHAGLLGWLTMILIAARA